MAQFFGEETPTTDTIPDGMIERTIFYRNSYENGDGWTYYPMQVLISENCPICGAKRGVPYQGRVIEDGEIHLVDNWNNPCGHKDSYEDCFLEHKRLQKSLNNTHNH